MEQAFSMGVILGSPLMAIIATVSLPASTWDSGSGRYRGYFNKQALGNLLFVVFFYGFLAVQEGKTGPETLSDVGFYLSVAIIVSRLCVEFSHHHKHRAWLHRQYHKLTGHDDPRETSS